MIGQFSDLRKIFFASSVIWGMAVNNFKLLLIRSAFSSSHIVSYTSKPGSSGSYFVKTLERVETRKAVLSMKNTCSRRKSRISSVRLMLRCIC
jgi:hypothetical protein